MNLENRSKSLNAGQVYPLTVYYDGGCKLCTSEIDNIAARDVQKRLVLINCNTPSFDYVTVGATRQAMLNAIHARAADGAWLLGVDVFIVRILLAILLVGILPLPVPTLHLMPSLYREEELMLLWLNLIQGVSLHGQKERDGLINMVTK